MDKIVVVFLCKLLIYFIGVQIVFCELIKDDEAGIRYARPWENVTTNSDVSKYAPYVNDDQGPEGQGNNEINMPCLEECHQVKQLLKRKSSLVKCCYGIDSSSDSGGNYYYSTAGGTAMTVPVLEGQIAYILQACPQCNQHKRKKRALHIANVLWKKTNIKYCLYHSRIQEEIDAIKEVLEYLSNNTCFELSLVDNCTLADVAISNNYAELGQQPCMATPGGNKISHIPHFNLQSRVCFRENNKLLYRTFLTNLGLISDLLRFDREETVTFHDKNVKNSYTADMTPIAEKHMYTDFPFDIGSVKVFEPIGEFSLNDNPAFTSRDPLYQLTLGSSTKPSFYDLYYLEALYCEGCSKKCGEGFTNSATSCQTCVCPDGFDGEICDKAKNGSGLTFIYTNNDQQKIESKQDCNPSSSKLTAGDSVQSIISPNYDGSRGSHYYGDMKTTCNWIITANSSSCFVKVWFDPDFDVPCLQNTCLHYVEIKYRDDKKLTGPRFCCKKSPEYYNSYGNIQSEDNSVVVIFNSEVQVMRDPRGFKLYYQQECDSREMPSLPPKPVAPFIDTCIQESGFTNECTGETSFRQTPTQTRIMKCTREGNNGVKQCIKKTQTRECGVCKVVLESEPCIHMIGGQCILYESPTPQTREEFCNNLKYGPDEYEKELVGKC